jgi:hypothetical protein
MQELNAGADTVPGVSDTVIQTRYDEVVTPYTSSFLSGANVTNMLLQEQCALDPQQPVTPACTYVAPVAGG